MRQPDDSGFRMSIQSAKPVLAYIADLPNTSPETRAAIKELWDM
jgi:predicted secreted Zn-dependent protease